MPVRFTAVLPPSVSSLTLGYLKNSYFLFLQASHVLADLTYHETQRGSGLIYPLECQSILMFSFLAIFAISKTFS